MFEGKFEELIANALRNNGYKVETQVGYSGYKIDLAIINPITQKTMFWGLNVMKGYLSVSQERRERDVMRHEFLESRGWVMERIWSINWWKNPDLKLMIELCVG